MKFERFVVYAEKLDTGLRVSVLFTLTVHMPLLLSFSSLFCSSYHFLRLNNDIQLMTQDILAQ